MLTEYALRKYLSHRLRVNQQPRAGTTRAADQGVDQYHDYGQALAEDLPQRDLTPTPARPGQVMYHSAIGSALEPFKDTDCGICHEPLVYRGGRDEKLQQDIFTPTCHQGHALHERCARQWFNGDVFKECAHCRRRARIEQKIPKPERPGVYGPH